MSAAVPSPILWRFRAQPQGLPKYARLRGAVIEAVQAGELPLGARVAGECELSALLGLSLGTTQKALGCLMSEGFLVRRQGHGTFVGSPRRPIAGSWHFRFVAPEGGPVLPVFASILDRERVGDNGPWSAQLGPDPKGYVRIQRRIDVGGRFDCYSDIYLGASRFGALLRMAEKRLADTNLKAVLETQFSAPTLQSEGLAHLVQFSKEQARLLGIKAKMAWGLRVDIVGRSFGRAIVSFQQMYVPPTGYGLQLDFKPPGAAGNEVLPPLPD